MNTIELEFIKRINQYPDSGEAHILLQNDDFLLIKDTKLKHIYDILLKNNIQDLYAFFKNINFFNKEIINNFFIDSPTSFSLNSSGDFLLNYEFQIETWANNFSMNDCLNFLEIKLLGPEIYYSDTGDEFGINLKLNLNTFREKSIIETIDYINIILIDLLNELNKNNKNKIEYFYKIDNLLKTGIKQYIVYFNEFILNTKGIIIDFEVASYPEGLILKLNKNQNIHKIEEYFIEYMNYLRCQDIENIKLLYEIKKSENEMRTETMILKNEIYHLKHKYELLELSLEYKKNTELFYKKIISEMLESNKITASNKSDFSKLQFNIQNTQSTTNNVNFTSNIENLQNSIEEIKELISFIKDDILNKEIEEIDNQLLEVTTINDLKDKKKSLNLFKRILNRINDDDSTLNKLIKAGEKSSILFTKIKPLIPIILENIEALKKILNYN